MPAVMNAANEVAVDAFCDGRLSFLGITESVRDAMDAHERIEQPVLEQILEEDTWARQHVTDAL